ncbi:XRE family transcriptional regulator (plasmid) [Sinorhizobium meliloti]
MAGPTLEQWISDLGLQQVNDPHVDKPVYRMPPLDGRITLSAALEENICTSIREARERRNLSRSKLAPLLGLSEAGLRPLRNKRFPPHGGPADSSLRGPGGKSGRDSIIAGAPPMGGNGNLRGAAVGVDRKARTLDEETLRDVLSLLSRIESQTNIDSDDG